MVRFPGIAVWSTISGIKKTKSFFVLLKPKIFKCLSIVFSWTDFFHRLPRGFSGDLILRWIWSLQEGPRKPEKEINSWKKFVTWKHFALVISTKLYHSLVPSKLMLLFHDFFQDMNQTYDSTSCLLAVHRGWKGGIHIQSCGHHMHYDCRSSYCETLRSTLR